MTFPTKDTAHKTEARALLIDQFSGRAVIQGMLDSWANQAQELEDAIWDVILGRVLDNAINAQLDSIGDLVGETRQGRPDNTYREAIRLRVRVNRANGKAEDVIQVASLSSGGVFEYEEYYPAGFEVQAYDIAGARELAQNLSEAKAAGTKGNLITSDWDLADVFLLDYDGGGVADPGLLDYDGITIVSSDLLPWGADA